MFFSFSVSSKDNQVLKKFCRFLIKLETLPTILKYFSKRNKRKFITILKSPHVNKTAQEQFEFRYYKREFIIDSFKPLMFLLILKKIKNLSFPGLKLELKGLLSLNRNNKSFLKVLNPDRVVLKRSENGLVSKPGQKKYIELFDSYGELRLKELFYSLN